MRSIHHAAVIYLLWMAAAAWGGGAAEAEIVVSSPSSWVGVGRPSTSRLYGASGALTYHNDCGYKHGVVMAEVRSTCRRMAKVLIAGVRT